MNDTRPCTCAPDERPYPCQRQYALGLCRKAEIRSLRAELDRCIAQIGDLAKLRSEEEITHGHVMGRIAVALFGERNNRTDEECVKQAIDVVCERNRLRQHLHDEHQRHIGTMDERDALTVLLREVRDHTGKCQIPSCVQITARIDAALAAKEVMEKSGEWTAFALEAEHDAYGMTRIAKWHNELCRDLSRHVAIAAEQAQELERHEELRAERDALRDEVGLRRHTMPAQYAKLIAERDTLQKERDHALEMLNVQDNKIDALRAALRIARATIYSLDAREIYDDELALIDAVLANGKP